MRCTVALSTAEETAVALRDVLEQLGGDPAGTDPDLVVVFSTPHHREGLRTVVTGLHRRLAPGCLLGTTAAGLIGPHREIEASPALVAFAGSFPGVILDPFHATFDLDGKSGRLIGFPFDRVAAGDDVAILTFADPFTFPMDALLTLANEKLPGVPVIGGLASGGAVPGMNRLFLDDTILDEGAVGVVVAGDVRVRTIVSQGCRPVGRHFVITKGQQNVIEELGGRPALEVLEGVIEGLTDRDRALFQRALHIGRVIDEYRSGFSRGDFLVRSVMGIDRAQGSLAINDYIRRGQTVQFHVRDPASATEDLDLLLQENAEMFRRPAAAGALLFSCNGRGRNMFDEPNHDVAGIARAAGDLPVAGFFAAGEIGPVGGQNFLHGFTASMAFFCRR